MALKFHVQAPNVRGASEGNDFPPCVVSDIMHIARTRKGDNVTGRVGP